MNKQLYALLAESFQKEWCPDGCAAWLEKLRMVSQDVVISSVSMDSRAVRPGSLFLACQGVNGHGLSFVSQAITQGAVAVLWEPSDEVSIPSGCPLPCIAIPKLSVWVSHLTGCFFDNPSHRLNVIGVTGTNGKTTCSHWLSKCWQSVGENYAVLGTLGCGYAGEVLNDIGHTTPSSVSVQALLSEAVQRQDIGMVMEVSSHGLHQHRVSGVRFQGAVFTNLSRDHLDYHGTMVAYREAKKRLFKMPALCWVVLNLDDPFSQDIFPVLSPEVSIWGYSQNSRVSNPSLAACIWATDVCFTSSGLSLQIHDGDTTIALQLRLWGRFNVDNLLAVVTAWRASGQSLISMKPVLESLTPVNGRMEYIEKTTSDQPTVVIDYAHTPDALEKALTALRLHHPSTSRLTCVFGCGGNRDQGKRSLMGEISERLADNVILTDDNPRFEPSEKIIEQIAQGLLHPDQVMVISDRGQAIRWAITQSQPEDIVLIAGKGHEDYQWVQGDRLFFSDRECVEALFNKTTERGD
jgi:UDP-N-acetylmuramoyl-L-alanyl-D-glutamate--2,6-diaminopimelate ligase